MRADMQGTMDSVLEKVLYEKDMYLRERTEVDMIRTHKCDRLYLQRIRAGDTKAILSDREKYSPPTDPCTKDAEKRVEYTVCAAITLAAHAAIDGGLDPTSAYAINDIYLRRLGACRDS